MTNNLPFFVYASRECVTRMRLRFGEEFEFGKNGILANPKPKAKVGRGKGRCIPQNQQGE